EAALWPRQAGFWSEKRYRRRGAWLPRIARRGVRATCACVAASLALCGAAGAQPSDNPLGDLLKPREAEARLPSADEAMEAYRAVEGWVREWSDPGPAPCPASAVRVGLYQR